MAQTPTHTSAQQHWQAVTAERNTNVLPLGGKLKISSNHDLMHCLQLCSTVLRPVKAVGVHICSCASHVAGDHDMPRTFASTYARACLSNHTLCTMSTLTELSYMSWCALIGS